jgi:hypothetical protein
MGQLDNLFVSQSFQGLIKLANSTTGVTNTLQYTQDGSGNNLPIQISATQVNITGSLTVNGSPISSGSSGSSGTSGSSGSNGTDGTSGTSGSSGVGFRIIGEWDNTTNYLANDMVSYNGSSYIAIQDNINKIPSIEVSYWLLQSLAGSNGTSGTSGTDGTSGTSGSSGSDGTSGTSGSSGTDGTSGTSGSSGTNGTSGTSGSSGSSGTSGSSGSSGTSGSSGSSGTSGSSGSSGTSGDSIFALTGSVWNTTNNVGVTGSVYVDGNLYNLSLNTTVQPSLYLTSSQAGQVNIIKGWSENPSAGGPGSVQANYTGSVLITGSNNTLSLPQLRATALGGGADQVGYISGSDNVIASNGSGIFLNTGSLLFPKTSNNNIGATSVISMNFTTSSLAGGHPLVNSNTLIGGTIQLNHNSGSVNSNLNLINGGSISSTQVFVTNVKPAITSNIVNSSVTLNHISSSINYQSNFNNASVTVNNHVSSSAIANNSLNINNNTIIGGAGATGPGFYISGSQNSNVVRTFTNNLIGGNNIIVSSSYVSSSNANLVSTVIFGSNLSVSGSHSSTTAGGSAFFGRFNATGSLQESSQDTVFVVGSGLNAGSRRNAIHVDSASNIRLTGSVRISGSITSFGGGDINNNTVYGDAALPANTTGTNNLAFGNNALQTNVSGSFNLAVGSNALASNKANNNMAVGASALFNNQVGENNTALGASSLFQNRIGNGNLAVGRDTMYNNVSGSNNTAIGKSALLNNVSGSNNIVLGTEAGYNETGNNNFYVNNSNRGNVDADRSGSLFWGQLDATTANQKLQINAATDIRNNLVVSGSLSVGGNKQFNVGAFQSTQSQSGSANVSQSITYDTTDYSQGVSFVSGSRLTVANKGVYNIQFSAQIDRVAGSGTDTAYIWLKKNGTNVTNTAGAITISGGAAAAKTISSWNYVVDSAAGDYYELVWQSTDSNIQLINVAASGNIPGIPSIITTVTQVR